MTRLYYDKPIDAAQMAELYGVEFIVKTRVRVKKGVPGRYSYEKRDVRLANPWSICSSIYKNKKLYVTKDSLHILFPQDGDFGLDGADRPVKYVFGKWILCSGDLSIDGSTPVFPIDTTLRWVNGKYQHFFTPKSEESND